MRREQLVIDDTGSVEGIYAFIYCTKWISGRVSRMPDRQTTLKDRATQLLTKYKSGALVTQSKIEYKIHQHQRQQHPPLSFSFWAEVAKTVSSRTYLLLLISCLSEQLQSLFSLLRR